VLWLPFNGADTATTEVDEQTNSALELFQNVHLSQLLWASSETLFRTLARILTNHRQLSEEQL
jgi:hypothetical protein